MSEEITSNEGMMSLGIPENCTFWWIASKISKFPVHYLGFNREDLNSSVKSQQYGPDTPLSLIKNLGAICNPPLKYTVEEKGNALFLTLEG